MSKVVDEIYIDVKVSRTMSVSIRLIKYSISTVGQVQVSPPSKSSFLVKESVHVHV